MLGAMPKEWLACKHCPGSWVFCDKKQRSCKFCARQFVADDASWPELPRKADAWDSDWYGTKARKSKQWSAWYAGPPAGYRRHEAEATAQQAAAPSGEVVDPPLKGLDVQFKDMVQGWDLTEEVLAEIAVKLAAAKKASVVQDPTRSEAHRVHEAGVVVTKALRRRAWARQALEKAQAKAKEFFKSLREVAESLPTLKQEETAAEDELRKAMEEQRQLACKLAPVAAKQEQLVGTLEHQILLLQQQIRQLGAAPHMPEERLPQHVDLSQADSEWFGYYQEQLDDEERVARAAMEEEMEAQRAKVGQAVPKVEATSQDEQMAAALEADKRKLSIEQEAEQVAKKQKAGAQMQEQEEAVLQMLQQAAEVARAVETQAKSDSVGSCLLQPGV